MKTFEFNSIEESYQGLLKALLEEGKEVAPRGQLTKEITPVAITIKDPTKRVISSKERKLNYGFMCAELTWILLGSNNVDFIGHYNSIWKRFTDDGVTLNGAYGDRIFGWDSGIRREAGIEKDENGNDKEVVQYNWIKINQFEEAYKQLKKDQFTRQATIVLFDPYKDYRETKDKPCTNLLRFIIRDGKLHMRVFMRSNDIWLGYPYDVFNFTMLQEIMAGMLGVEVGEYVHMADSFHLYEMHFEAAKNVINENFNSIYNNTVNAKISYDGLNNLSHLFEVENETRTNKDADVESIISTINNIENEYFKSIAAVLSLYNFRKHERSQEDMDKIKPLITNEFNVFTNNWKSRKVK